MIGGPYVWLKEKVKSACICGGGAMVGEKVGWVAVVCGFERVGSR